MPRGGYPELLREEPRDIISISPQHRIQAPPIPAPRTSFIGREREVERVHELLERHDVPLITLTGLGGVGKTRIAIHAVSSAPHPASFVDLSDVQQAGLVLPAIAAALGVHPAGRLVLDSLKAVFRDGEFLLVLDNFEQVLPAASAFADLLDACPRLRVLVTSRAVLGVPGEHVVDIRPFPLPEALPQGSETEVAGFDVCRLFVDRAQALLPEFALTSANAGTIVAICQRVDGLPLAIELAAAWLPVLSPAELLMQLESRLDLPGSGAAGTHQRQRTMRDAIAWSYGLLSPQAQMMFRRLSVFIGGCTLDAVKVVCEYGALDALRELRALIANSLVRRTELPGQESRYTMLETVREFGLECLQKSGEADAVRQRYAAYYLGLARRVEAALNTHDREVWLDRLESEQGNVHSVLSWAIERQDAELALDLAGSLLPFWQFRFYSNVGQDWAQQALTLNRDVTAPVLRKALFCAGTLAYMNGKVADARKLLDDALVKYHEAGDQAMTGRVESTLGRIAWDQGELEVARAWFDSATKRFDASGDKAGLAWCLHYQGLVAFTGRDYRQAATCLHDASTLWQSLGFNWELTCCIPGHLADVARAQGKLDDAMRLYQECLSLNWDRQDLENVAWSLVGLAIIAHADGQVEQAARLMALAGQFRERTGAPLTPHIDRDHLHAAEMILESVGAERFATIRAGVRDAGSEAGIAEALSLTRRQTPTIPASVNALGLTQRELEVLRKIAAGKSNRDIANELFVSPGTVKVHVTHILAKLDLPSRSAATDYAHRHGLA
jgi:non-specific serine/threonine protein kinase